MRLRVSEANSALTTSEVPTLLKRRDNFAVAAFFFRICVAAASLVEKVCAASWISEPPSFYPSKNALSVDVMRCLVGDRNGLLDNGERVIDQRKPMSYASAAVALTTCISEAQLRPAK